LAAAELALSNTANERWRDDFDVPALIGWYLVNEPRRNYDARLVSSIYLHKRRGGPLVFGLTVLRVERGIGTC
jgi:hypothetical protein